MQQFFLSRGVCVKKFCAKNKATEIFIGNNETHAVSRLINLLILMSGTRNLSKRVICHHQQRCKKNDDLTQLLSCFATGISTTKETECYMDFCDSVTSMQHALHISSRRIVSRM